MMVFMHNLGQAETLVGRSMFGKPLKNSKMIGLTILHCFWNEVFATQWHVHEKMVSENGLPLSFDSLM